MLFFPNAKINIGLNVIRQRDDGFHDIEAGFFPISWYDIIECLASKHFAMHTTGVALSGALEENSVYCAYQAIKNRCPAIPDLAIHLHKTIPAAAGLGGGSSDAAFMLKELSKTYDCDLAEKELAQMTAEQGSDCPFFLFNKPAVGRGRGEEISPIMVDLSGYELVVVNPGISVPTAEAYRNVSHSHHEWGLERLLQKPPTQWEGRMHNAFEEYVFWKYPKVGALKGKLYRLGATFAGMSGSGSTVFALFEKGQSPDSEKLSNFPYVRFCQFL